MAALPRFNVPDIVDERGFELVRCDPEAGKSLWMKVEPDGQVIFEEIVQLDPLFRSNEILRSEQFNQRWDDGKIAASLPLEYAFSSGYMEATKQGDKAWIKRFLNDSENAKFRTKEGRI